MMGKPILIGIELPPLCLFEPFYKKEGTGSGAAGSYTKQVISKKTVKIIYRGR